MTLSGGLCKDLLRFGVGNALSTGFWILGMAALGQAQAGTTTPGGVKDRVCLGSTRSEEMDWARCEATPPVVLIPEITGDATNALGARDISGPLAGVEITLCARSLRGLQNDDVDLVLLHTSLEKNVDACNRDQ